MGLLMTTANVATRRGNGTLDCDGAQIRAYCHHLATVVTIRGVIDAANVDWVGAYILRFTLGSDPVVLDLSDLSHFAAEGVSLLRSFDDDCRAAGVEWTLVAGPAISELLDDGRDQDEFPMTRSVREALHNLADAIASRRQLVLPLIRKTA
jgi:anti-anti-sigma regulatory factor